MSLAILLLTAFALERDHPSPPPRHSIGRAGATTRIAHQVRVPANGYLEFRGMVTFDRGSELIASHGATLLFSAGSRLIVGRDARLSLEGTALQPVVLTCSDIQRTPGCWDGVVVNGNAPINIGQATSPPARGSGAGGCREVVSGAAFGGCDASDSSGVLRYVRIEYATTGLQLRGVGRATTVANVQVHRSASDGIRIEGGAVRLARVWATANAGHGLIWTHGWQGDAQSIAVLQDPDASAGGIEGRNTDSGADVDALPRSAPRLYNVTVLAGSKQNNPRHSDPPPAVRLSRGTAGTLRNLLLYQSYTALDVDDAATCAQAASGALVFENVLVAGAYSAVSPDAEPSQCTSAGMGEMDLLTRTGAGNNIVADANGLMVRPDDSYAPDLRLRAEGLAASFPAASPPSDGWFDPGARHVGAVPSATAVIQSNIAWYMGWTVGGPMGVPILPTTNYAMRFYANNFTDLGRVKIPLDNPHRPVDVGGTFTIEFWIRGRLADNSEGPVPCGSGTDAWIEGNILLDRDRFTAPRDYGLAFLAGRVALGVRNDQGGDGVAYTLCGSTSVLDDQWHHVAITRNGATGALVIYVDGFINATGTGSAGDISYPDGAGGSPNDPYLVIGAEKHDVGPQYPGFNGFIDELRISTVIRYTTSFVPPGGRFTVDANTAALYHFDEGSGTVLVDAVGSSNGVVRVGGSPAGPVWVPPTASTN